MLVLGIDPGTRATGYGAVAREADRFVCAERGVIRPRSTDPLARRLLTLHDALDALVVRVRPDVIAVEDCFQSRNARSTLKLGHVKGLALVVAARHGIEVHEYAPRRVKQAVVGRGGATKEQVQFMVTRMIAGLLSDTDGPGALPLDLTDALAVAVCHHHVGRLAASHV